MRATRRIERGSRCDASLRCVLDKKNAAATYDVVGPQASARNAIAQNRSPAHKSVVWCPGRGIIATTDTTNRCLCSVWWRECCARWRREAVVLEDFDELRKAGLTHPLMDEIKEQFSAAK